MAIMIKTPQEIEKMRRSGGVVREVLETVRGLVKAGATTLDLENAAEADEGLWVRPHSKKRISWVSLCALHFTSLNEEVVHGIRQKTGCCAMGTLSPSIVVWW